MFKKIQDEKYARHSNNGGKVMMRMRLQDAAIKKWECSA